MDEIRSAWEIARERVDKLGALSSEERRKQREDKFLPIGKSLAEKYLKEYEHPLVKNYNPPPRKALRGHGAHTTQTPLTWHLLIEALREDKMPYFDVYDSVTSSVISPLSEMSVANKSNPVEFPDFTKGKWQNRPPLEPG